MFALFGIVTVVSAVLILPGWVVARREYPQGPAILFLALPGILFWVTLTTLGVGAQSLANVVEVFGTAAVSVIVAYIKLLVMDRRRIRHGGTISVAAVLAVTLLLRLFVPVIPE